MKCADYSNDRDTDLFMEFEYEDAEIKSTACSKHSRNSTAIKDVEYRKFESGIQEF
jgi:hypothetical protein